MLYNTPHVLLLFAVTFIALSLSLSLSFIAAAFACARPLVFCSGWDPSLGLPVSHTMVPTEFEFATMVSEDVCVRPAIVHN